MPFSHSKKGGPSVPPEEVDKVLNGEGTDKEPKSKRTLTFEDAPPTTPNEGKHRRSSASGSSSSSSSGSPPRTDEKLNSLTLSSNTMSSLSNNKKSSRRGLSAAEKAARKLNKHGQKSTRLKATSQSSMAISRLTGRATEQDVDDIGAIGDLVLYNEEGKPYIDVNRLVYNPKRKVVKQIEEKVSWYVSDYAFIISNFFTLVCSAYALCIGIILGNWSTSMESVSVIENNTGEMFKIDKIGISLTPTTLAFLLSAVATLNAVNILVGVYGSLQGFRFILLQHAVLDVILFVVMFTLGILIYTRGRCDPEDLEHFQESVETLIYRFLQPDDPRKDGDFKESKQYFSAIQLNELQISMQCCGASNWTDYINPKVLHPPDHPKIPITKGLPGATTPHPKKSNRIFDADEATMILPFSCCRPWWVRNLHCADMAHTWAYPDANAKDARMFRERINQIGCSESVWLHCRKLVVLGGFGLMINSIIYCCFIALEILSAMYQIRILTMVVREIRGLEDSGASKIGRKEETSSSSESDDISRTSRVKKPTSYGMRAIDDIKKHLAPPTEDEIHFIKSRTAFARFEAQTRTSHIGKMIEKVRAAVEAPVTVTLGQLDHSEEKPMTVQSAVTMLAYTPSMLDTKDFERLRSASQDGGSNNASKIMKKARKLNKKPMSTPGISNQTSLNRIPSNGPNSMESVQQKRPLAKAIGPSYATKASPWSTLAKRVSNKRASPSRSRSRSRMHPPNESGHRYSDRGVKMKYAGRLKKKRRKIVKHQEKKEREIAATEADSEGEESEESPDEEVKKRKRRRRRRRHDPDKESHDYKWVKYF